MKFELYTATDSRDNTRTFWLKALNCGLVAQYHIKTSPSRIKRNSLHPDSIVWSARGTFDSYAVPFTVKFIDSWEWAE